MKILTIIRHAKSSWENPDVEDMARPLNDRGKNALLLVGKYLNQQGIIPDLILASPAERALQTAIGISNQLGYNTEGLQILKEIYFGDTATLFHLILHINDKYKDVVLVGHEPVLSSLIIKLTGRSVEKFPTCSAFRISFGVKKWTEIKPGSGKCEFFVNPKLLGGK